MGGQNARIPSILGADRGDRIFARRVFERLRAGSVWVVRMREFRAFWRRTEARQAGTQASRRAREKRKEKQKQQAGRQARVGEEGEETGECEERPVLIKTRTHHR